MFVVRCTSLRTWVPVEVSQPVNSMLSIILCGRCASFPKIVCPRDFQMSILLLSYFSSLFEILFRGIAGSLDFPGFLIRVSSYRCMFRSFLRDLSVGKLFVAGFTIPTYKGYGIVLHW